MTTPDLSTKKQAAAADARGFEVVEARCARYRIPLEQPVLGASARTGVTPTPLSAWELVVVEVRTAAGHVGTGFAYELRAGGRAVEAALRDDLLPLLTGADCRKTEAVWEGLYWATYNVGRRGAYIHAISAVDIALWDAKARALGQSLASFLGASRDRISLYESDCGWLSLPRAELVRLNSAAVEAGFAAVKIMVGAEQADEDVRRVGAVRRAIGPSALLMLDASQKWSLQEARERIRRLEEFDLYWVEEPLRCDDVRGHELLAAELQTRIATGQSLTTRFDFEPLLEAGAVHVIQPDVARVGGVTEWLRLAQAAKPYGVEIAPHFLMELHVSLAAATSACTFVERTPWLSRVLEEPPTVEEGSLRLPAGPGHGLVLRRDLEEFRLA